MIRQAELGVVGGLIMTGIVSLLIYWLEHVGRPRKASVKLISCSEAFSMWYAHRKRKWYWF